MEKSLNNKYENGITYLPSWLIGLQLISTDYWLSQANLQKSLSRYSLAIFCSIKLQGIVNRVTRVVTCPQKMQIISLPHLVPTPWYSDTDKTNVT